MNCAASSSRVPRTTSSKRFVSSRHTAADLSGISSASTAKDLGSRRGDSKATTAPGHRASARAELAELSGSAREISHELVAAFREAADDQSGLHRGCSGENGYVEAGRGNRTYQPRTRIVDAGQAGIGYERHSFTPPKSTQHLPGARCLVVAVVAEQSCFDRMPIEEDPRASGVLAEDGVGLPQLRQHAKRHVLEVPDRGRADRERHSPTPVERLESDERGSYETGVRAELCRYDLQGLVRRRKGFPASRLPRRCEH